MSRRIQLIALLVCLAVLAFWLYPRGSDDFQGLQRSYRAGEYSGVLEELSQRPDAAPAALLLQAQCASRLGLDKVLQETLERSRVAGASEDAIALIQAVHNVRDGRIGKSAEEVFNLLVDAGADLVEARSAVSIGLIQSGRRADAESFLNAWRGIGSGSAEFNYCQARLLGEQGNLVEARRLLQDSLDGNPKHELTWLLLADLLAAPPDLQLDECYKILVECGARFPENPAVPAKLGNIARRVGRPVFDELATNADWQRQLGPIELARQAFDDGSYEESRTWLERARLGSVPQLAGQAELAFETVKSGDGSEGERLTHVVNWSAMVHALAGQKQIAYDSFALMDWRTSQLRRLQDLLSRDLDSPSPREDVEQAVNEQIKRPALSREASGAAGMYADLCANCHGDGERIGIAGYHLQPPPRLFRLEPLRYVSNTDPRRQHSDVLRVLRHGIPGTSMPAFERLADNELSQLASLVLGFEGESSVASLREAFSADEQRFVNASKISDPEKGRELYRDAGCQLCHERQPAAAAPARWFDSLGRPVSPPDLRRDLLRGGQLPLDLYRRIAIGIPGTPHPSLSASPEQIANLVAYLIALRSPSATTGTNFARKMAVDGMDANGKGRPK